MAELKPRKFVGPTHGLRARAGQGLSSNLENIGGRILIQSEMSNHKTRMKTIKAQVNITPPWSHKRDMQLSRPGSSAARRPPSAGGGRLEGSSLSITDRPSSAAGRPAGGAAALVRSSRAASAQPSMQSSLPPQPAAEFDIGKLTADQQKTYRDMLRMLCTLRTEDSKVMLEQLYKDSEDRKLLAAYTGVFPGLEQEGATVGSPLASKRPASAGKPKTGDAAESKKESEGGEGQGTAQHLGASKASYDSHDEGASERTSDGEY